MKRVDMYDAETNLSRNIAELAPGETILLCNRNEPVAELRAVNKNSNRFAKLGGAEGEFELTDAFFEPLPKKILKAFRGE